jgi:hypothetical protein
MALKEPLKNIDIACRFSNSPVFAHFWLFSRLIPLKSPLWVLFRQINPKLPTVLALLCKG